MEGEKGEEVLLDMLRVLKGTEEPSSCFGSWNNLVQMEWPSPLT